MNTPSKPYAFFAYPATPPQFQETIERAISRANAKSSSLAFRGWPKNDIAGRPLTAQILSSIDLALFLFADVTTLNFNVTYEIGYAIGINKRAYMVRNKTLQDDVHKISKVGIFDTLGYVDYENADSLADILRSVSDPTAIEITAELDHKAPVYLLETPYRDDVMNRIISRVKKARLQFRSFNPSEEIRMAAMETVKHVANSHGVVIPLLPDIARQAEIHNIRGAFIAGLAHGMEKETLILQRDDELVPLDVRDFAKPYSRPRDIDHHINSFALDVVQSMQCAESIPNPNAGNLAQVSIGDPMAENEFQNLEHYYLRRDEFGRTVRGEVNLVVGRKGMGKTALFSQVRNEIRRDRSIIVVDLKPEGYQLVKLKEAVLDHLTEGAKAHLITAFWEYMLLMEVAYKLLEKDIQRHKRDHRLYPLYANLQASYANAPSPVQGDFSERLLELSSHLTNEYLARFSGSSEHLRITSDEVTEILHKGNLGELRAAVSNYLRFKHGVWILFDNLDKGWSTPGPTTDDILILRCLIDAGRKIQREMKRLEHDFHCIVFIRNDVYQLLMKENPDFGKEMRVSLDWNDGEMLREMMRLRLLQNGYGANISFSQIWGNLCISHYKSEETSQYMVDRCLMRPRNLIKIFNHCKGFAVNFQRDRIEPEDIDKGMLSYSNDLFIEADQELSNIEPEAEGLIYHFIEEDWKFSHEDLLIIFGEHSLPEEKYGEVIRFLLYFGFFGIQFGGHSPIYIYDVGYDMKRLDIQVDKHIDHLEYALNPAFWPALGVSP